MRWQTYGLGKKAFVFEGGPEATRTVLLRVHRIVMKHALHPEPLNLARIPGFRVWGAVGSTNCNSGVQVFFGWEVGESRFLTS